MSEVHVHRVRVYYEDTDFSGAVYHANYLRYMERGREHLLGPDDLRTLWRDHGVGFVVYTADLKYRAPAGFADELEVRTTVVAESAYRLGFQQDVHRSGDDKPLVEGRIQLVCVGPGNAPVKIPEAILARLT